MPGQLQQHQAQQQHQSSRKTGDTHTANETLGATQGGLMAPGTRQSTTSRHGGRRGGALAEQFFVIHGADAAAHCMRLQAGSSGVLEPDGSACVARPRPGEKPWRSRSKTMR